jgi:putative ABC transport system substrate-binding protein
MSEAGRELLLASPAMREPRRGRSALRGPPMRRRDFLSALAGATACSARSRAAQRANPVIGYLYAGSFGSFPDGAKAFWRGLAEFGYEKGRNVGTELREAHNDLSRLPDLALDLVRRAVSVIVVQGSMEAALAAKSATDNIPIVFDNAVTDPVRAGLVASLSRPGGNVTGIANFGGTLSAKRLELAKLLVPDALRIGILVTPINPVTALELANAQEGARALSLETIAVTAGSQPEIDAAFAVLAEKRVDAVCVIPVLLLFDRRGQIVELAARYRLPAVYPFAEFARSGGLMSYGTSLTERSYQVGRYVGLILNGANPAELPVRRLANFELAINMRAARELGLTVPARFLALADEVIE